MVSGLARSMESSTNLRIICRYFHKNLVTNQRIILQQIKKITMHNISFLFKYIISWSTTDLLVHFRFDSNIIRCFYTSYFDKDGHIVPVQADKQDQWKEARIREYFVDIFTRTLYIIREYLYSNLQDHKLKRNLFCPPSM